MKSFVLLLSALLCLAVGSAVCASGNIYGVTGIIETPTDLVVGKQATVLSGTYVADFLDGSDTLTTWGGSYGISEKLEVSWSSFKNDAPGAGSTGITSAKLMVTQESAATPGMAIGVVDIGNDMKKISSGIDDVSYYVVFGRTLTSELDRFRPRSNTTPVRGAVGFGKGIYNGVFGSLDFYLAPKLEMKLEYLNKGIRDKSTLNAGVQMNLVPSLTFQAGLLGLKDFYGSVSYTLGSGF